MSVIEKTLEYTEFKTDGKLKTAAVIVCGGNSSRMGGVDKMFAEIKGKPVIARSIEKFQNTEAVDGIVVVTKDENVLKVQQLCETYGFNKVTDIVCGGNCRQESVKNGIDRLKDDVDIVLIHDGARPFVTEECILRVIDGATHYSAVTCAVPLKDTVKQIEKDGLVVGTPERSSLSAVQTPQGFRLELYKNAVEENKDRLEDFTDDCSIVESCGYAVYVVEGDYKNIKLTTADDLLYASVLAENEGE